MCHNITPSLNTHQGRGTNVSRVLADSIDSVSQTSEQAIVIFDSLEYPTNIHIYCFLDQTTGLLVEHIT